MNESDIKSGKTYQIASGRLFGFDGVKVRITSRMVHAWAAEIISGECAGEIMAIMADDIEECHKERCQEAQDNQKEEAMP